MNEGITINLSIDFIKGFLMGTTTIAFLVVLLWMFERDK